jgi:branched-chain amino acid transport system substrate-binding protein
MQSRTIAALLFAAGLTAPSAAPALAEDAIYIPLFTYRTGAYAGSGTFLADGSHDYLTMLNERDGGIGGVKLLLEECETGYDVKKGVECYDAVKGKNPTVIIPWSTGITLSLIPKAAVDKIPILSVAHGLSASARGNVFPWIFNAPVTYWDGLSQIVKYIGAQEGGLEKLKGKKLGYIYLDAGYGKEPIPLFQALATELGFDLKLYPVAGADMQNQSSHWLNVRRDKPDYMVMYGWGAMNPTAIKEAVKTGYPMDKFISVWWPTEDDARGAGEGAKGFKTLNWHATGVNFPAMADIQKYVIDKGKSQIASKDKVGQTLYNHGVYSGMLMAEGIANAQKLTGKKVVNGEDVRRGLEAINIDEARLKALGFDGFAGPLKLSCGDHNGDRSTFVQMWDGAAFVKASEFIEPLTDKVQPLLDAAAKDYVEKNTGWPARSEACDKP